MKRPTLQAPRPLTETHRLEGFRCTESALESWLKQRARRNQQDGASRCYVVCADDDVVGYYALAAGAVSHTQVPGSVRRNMPEPIPVVVLSRLAVHADWAGQGIGAGLLKMLCFVLCGCHASWASVPCCAMPSTKMPSGLPTSQLGRITDRTADRDAESSEASTDRVSHYHINDGGRAPAGRYVVPHRFREHGIASIVAKLTVAPSISR